MLFRCVYVVAVVVAFFVCWAPFHTQRLISIYSGCPTSSAPFSAPSTSSSLVSESTTSSPTTHQPSAATPTSGGHVIHAVLFYMSGILYYVSAVINPILYNIMSLKFRRAFRTTLCRPRPNDSASGRTGNNMASKDPRCCWCCCYGWTTGYGTVGRGDSAGAKRLRGGTAYRFSGRGQVEMVKVPRVGGAGPAGSDPGKDSTGGQSGGEHGRYRSRGERGSSMNKTSSHDRQRCIGFSDNRSVIGNLSLTETRECC